MVFRKTAILILGIFTLNSCEKTVTDPTIPFSIQTLLPKGVNQIYQAFAMPDNSFVVMTQDRTNNLSTLYRYSSKLTFIDSTSIEGLYYTKPIIENDGQLTMIANGLDNLLGVHFAVRLNGQLRITQKRNIQKFYTGLSGNFSYYNKLCRLDNGTYIVATTYERYPNLADKIVMFALKDLFNDNQVIWRVNPSVYSGEWLDYMVKGNGSSFYLAATDHLKFTANWVFKYDSSGTRLYELVFSQTHINYHIYADEESVIYHDFNNFYHFKPDGTEIRQVPYNSNYLMSTDLIRSGDHYFYGIDLSNTDGNFMQLRKTDRNLNVTKSVYFGNRGTNYNVEPDRYLLKLSSGEIVAVAMVENPDITGNFWLLQKFDEELELIK